MELILFILLAIVSLSQVAMFTLFFLEKRRSRRRNNSTIAYIESLVEDSVSHLRAEFEHKLNDINKSISESNTETENKISQLVLDYSEAQQAASKINDFGAGLSRIFDYDPIVALRKEREKAGGKS